jgi:hypothetical protein
MHNVPLKPNNPVGYETVKESRIAHRTIGWAKQRAAHQSRTMGFLRQPIL